MKVTYSVELLEATINKQVDRIEALEAALREIVNVEVIDPWSAAGTMQIKARAALAEGQDKPKGGAMMKTKREILAWLEDLERLIDETVVTLDTSTERIEELENVLRGIAGICLDKDHEAAVIAIAAVIREALPAELE
jgi:hypothetical protein